MTPGGPAKEDVDLRMVMAAAALAMFVVNLDFFALNLAVPGMAEDLDEPTTDMQWVISGFMLSLGAFLIPGGRLGDIYGRRRMLLVGTAIFGLTSLAGGLAPTADLLIAARILQGVGAAILFPLLIATISATFPPERQKRAIGNLYGLGAAATAVGPFVGGVLTEAISWRAVLLVNVPIAALALLLMVRNVPESRDESVPREIDLAGLASVVLGIAAVTLAVDRGDAWGWGSPETIGLFAAGALLLAAFIAVERRVSNPLVNLGLFRNRPFVSITLLGMTANVAFVVTTFAATLYLQDVRGYSPLDAGTIFLAASAMQAVAGPLSGRLAERFPIPRTMAASIGVGAAGLLVISFGGGIGIFAAALVVFGLGYGICWAMLSVGTQSVVETNRAGEASGVSLAIVIGAAGLCVAIASALIESLSRGGTGGGAAIEDILRTLAIASAVLAVPLASLARVSAGRGSKS